MKVAVAFLALVAAASGAKPVVNSHSTEEGQAIAQELLNDAMNKMGQTAEGAKKLAADPSLYKKFIAGQKPERKLAAAVPRAHAEGKATMHAYSREQGRLKGEEVIKARQARKNLRASS
jgi:hypothetical protein